MSKIDLFFIGFFVAVSIAIVIIKRDLPNWWTGLYLLGLLPVPISDYFRDKKKTHLLGEKTTQQP